MATQTWTDKGRSWSDSGAFTPSDPGPGDTALFIGDLFESTVAGDASVAAVQVISYGPIFTGTVTIGTHAGLRVDGGGQATFAQGGALATGGAVIVGVQSAGTLELNGSDTSYTAEATSGIVIIGQGGLSSGVADLTGGAWFVADFLTVGAGGMADLSVSSGGAIFIGQGQRGDMTIGKLASASGAVSISGHHSQIEIAGTLRVGVAGSGLLSVSAQGYLGAGTLDVAGSGAIALADGYVNIDGYATLDAGSSVTGSGSFAAGSTDNEGTVTARGLLYVGGPFTGDGTLAIADAGVMVLTDDVLALQHIAFAVSDAQLIVETEEEGPIPTVSASIAGFTPADSLLIEQIGSLSYAPATEVLTLRGSNGGEQLRFTGLTAQAAFRIEGHQGDLTKIVLTHG